MTELNKDNNESWEDISHNSQMCKKSETKCIRKGHDVQTQCYVQMDSRQRPFKNKLKSSWGDNKDMQTEN